MENQEAYIVDCAPVGVVFVGPGAAIGIPTLKRVHRNLVAIQEAWSAESFACFWNEMGQRIWFTALDILGAESLSDSQKLAITLNSDFLTQHVQRTWAAAVVDRMLPIYERHDPDDVRLRAAIELVRQYALGKVSEMALSDACDAAAEVQYKMAFSGTQYLAGIAECVGLVCKPGAVEVARISRLADLLNVTGDRAGELRWQVAYLRQVLTGAALCAW